MGWDLFNGLRLMRTAMQKESSRRARGSAMVGLRFVVPKSLYHLKFASMTGNVKQASSRRLVYAFRDGKPDEKLMSSWAFCLSGIFHVVHWVSIFSLPDGLTPGGNPSFCRDYTEACGFSPGPKAPPPSQPFVADQRGSLKRLQGRNSAR